MLLNCWLLVAALGRVSFFGLMKFFSVLMPWPIYAKFRTNPVCSAVTVFTACPELRASLIIICVSHTSDYFVFSLTFFLLCFPCLTGKHYCWGPGQSRVLEDALQQNSEGEGWPWTGSGFTEQVRVKSVQRKRHEWGCAQSSRII